MGNDRRAILALAALTCWLALASSAAAQSMLGGVVYDPTGRVAANVTVVVESEATGETWATRSSPIGLYAFNRLPDGSFTIRASFPPLSFIATGVQIDPRQKRAIDIKLRRSREISREESVTVHGTSALPRPLFDGSTGASYSREAIEGMPLTNGRDLQSILSVNAGIVVTENVGTPAQFTTLGQRRNSNRLTIDGVGADLAIDVSGPGVGQAAGGTLPAFSTTGSTQTLIPLSAIEEIQIRTSNASSEHARTPGAQTAIVTRSGTDRFKASAFTNIRPEEVAATEWFTNAGERPKGRMRYWDVGASLGGPILPRRVFYFGTYERQRIDRSVNTTVLVPSLLLRKEVAERPGGTIASGLLNAYPLPNGPEVSKGLSELSRVFPAVSRSSALSVRVDSNLWTRHRVFARVNHGRSEGDSLDDQNVPSLVFANTESTSTTTATEGITSAWSTATHELRLNVSRHRGSIVASPSPFGDAQPVPLAHLIGAGISEADAWTSIAFSAPVTPDSDTNVVLASGRLGEGAQRHWEVADTWSLLHGRHEWRFGVNYQHAIGATTPAANRYAYRFASVDDLVLGRARLVILERLTPARAHRQAWSLFAHDTFRASTRLSLTYGLRYSVKPAPSSRTNQSPLLVDFERLPQAHLKSPGSPLWQTSWNDLAPRVGATYQLSTIPRFEAVVRAGWSIAFDERSSNGLNAFGGGAPYASTRSFRPLTFPVDSTSLILLPPTPFASGDLSAYYSFPEDLRSPHTREWQVGIEQTLGRTHQLGILYVGNAGRELLYGEAYSFGAPIIGGPTVNAYSNRSGSDYHALVVEYRRRRVRGLQGQVSYTWSHAIDNDSGELLTLNLPQHVSPPAQNRASADFDKRHILSLTGSYLIQAEQLPKFVRPLLSNWQIDMMGTFQSGSPVTVIDVRNFDHNGYSVRPDPVPDAPIWIYDDSPTGRRVNPEAFYIPEDLRQGTLGRNTLRASPLRQVDLSASRRIQIGPVIAHLRVNAFNVLNVPSFGPPDNLFSPVDRFGRAYRSYADALGTGTLLRGGLAPIQQVGRSRSLQIGFRLDY